MQLSIGADCCCMRKIVDNDIQIYTVTFDEPLAFGSIDTCLRGRGDSIIRLNVAATQPDLVAPSSRADNLTQVETFEALSEGFAVGRGLLIVENDDVATKASCMFHCGSPTRGRQ